VANLAAVSFNYEHITGVVTGLAIASGSCTLHSVVVNTAATTVTVYDGPVGSAKVVAVIGTGVGTFLYDLTLVNGLFVTTTGAGTDLTVTGTF
jgi:hypothetical protein